eukprot:CAMPEP_0179084478 /NCGR_PEP_ID=MMETSP0796-20121207/38207_1 /TAXON_ID=73915 /ORGANISM="Pyrodinium bahamense, Strain pbaha01" /LENGTH=254 /DNA_ID=CAMNT_0020781903 /DNA_START=141 /DNA_END=905 /DNA_ORIENTATION=-
MAEPLGNAAAGSAPAVASPSDAKEKANLAKEWTEEKARELQAAVDQVFGTAGDSLLGLAFSFTIADPMIEGCPLIGCSTGFGALCGYTMEEIVGRNCRFLVDPVPAGEIDTAMRRHAKDFCLAVKTGKDYAVPEHEREPWMPLQRPKDELFCVQKNARKDGTLFNNMFYLKVLELGDDLGDEQPYIVGLQSELKNGKADLAEMCKNLERLDGNMNEVIKVVARNFFLSCSMRRQEAVEDVTQVVKEMSSTTVSL